MSSSRLGSVAILFCFLMTAAWAQIGTASLKGQVTDPSAAVIPGASVTAIGPGNKVKVASTNQQGLYTINGLAPGTYQVRVMAKGFTVFETSVEIRSGAPQTLDAALAVGPAAWAFGWQTDDWDRLAGAVVAGHVLECGTQATGGNFSFSCSPWVACITRRLVEGKKTTRKVAGVIPQSVIFEIVYVLQSQYGLTSRQAATVVDAVTKFPGLQIVDDCPWNRVLELWPDPLAGLTDAVIVALAVTNRYEAVATFDRKLANKLESFGLESYF